MRYPLVDGHGTDIPNGGGHVIFAQYEESGRITIFMDCIKKAEELIAGEQMEDLFKGADLFSVLLAHELFHAVEQEKRKTIFTQTEKIELWKRPFSNKSRLIALSEMAAMAFAGIHPALGVPGPRRGAGTRLCGHGRPAGPVCARL